MRCVKFSYDLAKPCDEKTFRLACSYTDFPLFSVNVKEYINFNLY